MARICSECKKPENFPTNPDTELRPYGDNGALICFQCATSPENVKRMESQFIAKVGTAKRLVLTRNGPVDADKFFAKGGN